VKKHNFAQIARYVKQSGNGQCNMKLKKNPAIGTKNKDDPKPPSVPSISAASANTKNTIRSAASIVPS
jgi:hypothetical protein